MKGRHVDDLGPSLGGWEAHVRPCPQGQDACRSSEMSAHRVQHELGFHIPDSEGRSLRLSNAVDDRKGSRNEQLCREISRLAATLQAVRTAGTSCKVRPKTIIFFRLSNFTETS